MRVPTRLVIWSVVALTPCGAALADSATMSASRDNTLFFDAEGDVSNGAGQHFFTGRNGMGNVRRGVLAFDLAAIPAGSTITSATLRLNMSSGDPVARTTNMHRLLADWGEGASDAPGAEGQGAPAAVGDATWLFRFFPGSAWTAPGGDFAAGISAGTPVGDLGFYTWSGAGLIADVQGWLDTPADNFGWIIRGDEATNGSAKRFDTRQNPDADLRPALIIEYTPVPAPSTGLAVAFATIAAARRRR